MFFNTYRKKLIIIIFIAVIPVLFISLVMNIRIKEETKNEVTYLKEALLRNMCEKIDMWIKDKEEFSETIVSNYPLLKDMISSEEDYEKINNYLESYVSNSESIENIYMVFEDNKNFSSTLKPIEDNLKEKDWYKNAYEKGGVSWTRATDSLLAEDTIITLSTPIYDENGGFIGVLGMDIGIGDLVNEIKEMWITNNGTIYVIDAKSDVVMGLGDDILGFSNKENEYNKEAEDFIKTLMSKDAGNSVLDLGNEYYTVYSKIPSIEWRIAFITEKNNFYQSFLNVYDSVIYLMSITFILVVILAFKISKDFSTPLEKLKKGAFEIQKGNYDYKIDTHKNDEFGQVAEAFNNMASQIKESHEKLESQTDQLMENNMQLQEMNIELEASFEQLQATMAQLNDSEERYRTLIENMHDLVWIIDENGILVFINNQVEDVLKYKKRELIGKNIFELVDIWNFENEYDNILDSLKDNDYKNLEIIFRARDGRRFIVELNTKRIYEKGILIGIQGVGRDITERKKMEQQLKQRNKELLTINEISRNLNTTFNLHVLLNSVVENIVKLMDIPICTIRLLEDNNGLKLYARSGVLKENIIAEKIYVDENMLTKATINSDINILYESVYNKDVENTKEALALHNVIYANIMPLKARNEVLGVLIVATRKELSESDFNILTSVSNQTAMVLENTRLYQNLKESYMKTIETLAAAVEAKDKYTEGHSLRVSKYGYMLANHLKLPKDICEDIKIAGILHDIGKIGISDSILSKPGRLTEEEYKAIIEHPMIGSKILESVGFSDTIMDAIKYHHKRYDLKGYPKDVYIDKLSISASIIGVADAFDAMTSNRAYRKAMTVKEALDELIINKGRQFNPVVVDAFIDIYNTEPWKIEEILKE